MEIMFFVCGMGNLLVVKYPCTLTIQYDLHQVTIHTLVLVVMYDENIVKVLSCLKYVYEWLLPNISVIYGDKATFFIHSTAQLSKFKDV